MSKSDIYVVSINTILKGGTIIYSTFHTIFYSLIVLIHCNTNFYLIITNVK